MRLLFIVSLLAALGACARTEATLPQLDAVTVEQERAVLIKAAIEKSRDRWERAYGLARPIFMANTEFCEKTALSSGLNLTDLKGLGGYIGGLEEEALKRAGYRSGVQIAFVTPDSPAAKAGLGRGGRLLAINGKSVEETARLKDINKQIAEAFKENPTLKVQIQEVVGEPRDVTLEGENQCDVPLRVSRVQAPSASASSKRITLTVGLLKSELSDAAIQFIIAHELAHITQRHVNKNLRNATVTGSIIYGPALGIAGTAVDIVFGLVGVNPGLGKKGFELTTYPWGREFEAEADYVGFYFYARAGLPLEEGEAAFNFLAREVPRRIHSGTTHPTLDKRVVAARLALAEIRSKMQVNEPLYPNGIKIKDEP